MFQELYNEIMWQIHNTILDDMWAHLAVYNKATVGDLAFRLAFVTRFAHVDDQPTLTSRNLKWSF